MVPSICYPARGPQSQCSNPCNVPSLPCSYYFTWVFREWVHWESNCSVHVGLFCGHSCYGDCNWSTKSLLLRVSKVRYCVKCLDIVYRVLCLILVLLLSIQYHIHSVLEPFVVHLRTQSTISQKQEQSKTWWCHYKIYEEWVIFEPLSQ